MEVIKPSKSQKELLDIISSILSSLKLKKRKRDDILLSLGKKINLIHVQDEENQEEKSQDFHHFYFFVKQVFLDGKGYYDLDLNKLKEIIGEEVLKEILESLIENLKSGNFLDFLLYLGELFSNLYFTKDSFNAKVKNLLQKGLNNYECIFRIFSICKKEEEIQYISGNYGIYFSVSYLNEIKYNLILATNIYIKLCLSDPNNRNLSFLKNDEEIKESSSDESDNKDKRMKDFEKFLINSIRIFWSNCIFIYSGDLVDFMNIFYEFITKNSFENHKFINTFDDSTKMFLEYMSYHLEKLFKYFDEDSLNEFFMSLYDFVDCHKGQNIKFVERALKIGAKNNLSKDKIGLISFICCNNKLMLDFEKLAASGKIKSLEDFEEVAEDNGYSEWEEYIVDYLIFNENAKEQDQNTEVNKIININNDYNDDKNDKSFGAKPESEKMGKEDQNKNIIEKKKENLGEDLEYKKLLSLIEQQKDTIKELKKKFEKLENFEKFENDIKKLKQDVDKLNDIHQTINFRDISKFYIKEFSRKYHIKGDNIFEQCQNILKFNFSEINDANLQQIIIKIVKHYLNGNKLSYIEKSYSSFMKLTKEEKNYLIANLRL